MDQFNHRLSLVFAFISILIEFSTEKVNANLIAIIVATIIASIIYYMIARIIIKVIECVFQFIIKD